MRAQEERRPHPRRLTRAEYHRLGELGFFREQRVELIRGIVYEMAPIGPPHANVVDRLMVLLVTRLATRAQVRVQQPFLAWDESEPEPDVAVVPLGNYAARHPDRALLVIEVAESSLEHDRDTKSALYARSGVPEYWIVDVESRTLEVRTGPAGDRYAAVARFAMGEIAKPAAFADVAVAVADLFA